jgi:hypothetical protein
MFVHIPNSPRPLAKARVEALKILTGLSGSHAPLVKSILKDRTAAVPFFEARLLGDAERFAVFEPGDSARLDA